MKKNIIFALALLLLCSCSNSNVKTVPEAVVDENTQFLVDKNINVNTIDNYLGLEDVCYRDVRMLYDPADFSQIGGEADLTATIKGFKVVPYPFIATLQELPVSGKYNGKSLFTVIWDENGKVKSVTDNYQESKMIIEELFPKNKKIFIVCGGGGYSNMLKQFLIYEGYDEKKLYNLGGAWEYKGNNKQELIVYPEEHDGDKIYATWRADYAYIDFDKLHKIN